MQIQRTGQKWREEREKASGDREKYKEGVVLGRELLVFHVGKPRSCSGSLAAS
jgi:hypothetical protein